MLPRLPRILIPVLIVLIFSLSRQINTSGQTSANNIFLPIVSYDPAGWIGPYGGTIVATAIDPFNPLVAYAGSFGSGIFKTIDGGNNWFSVNRGLANLEIYSLAVDPLHPSNLYAGTYRSQVFRSIDGGNTWTWSGNGMQDQAIVYSITVDPVVPSTIYASTRGTSNNNNPPWNGVLYKSADSGQTWNISRANVGGEALEDWAYSLIVNPNDHRQVFAAYHESGPARSDDSGITWNPILTGINDLSGRSIIISPQPESSSNLYYGVWHFDSLYKTLNSGDLWSRAKNLSPYVKVYSMAIDPFTSDVVYVASFSDGILKTVDGGDNWQASGLDTDKIYTVTLNPGRTSSLFAGTSGDGLYRSLDYANTWQHTNSGINNADVSAVVNSPADPSLIFSSVYGAGVYQTTNKGQSWQEINSGLDDKFVHDLALDPAHPSLLYALTDTGGMYQYDLNTADGWIKVGSGLPLTMASVPTYPSDHPLATLDMMESFAYPATQEDSASVTNSPLLNMVYSPADPQIAYLGTSVQGAYRSNDGGLTWLSIGLGGQTIYGMAADLADPDLVYAVTSATGSLKVSKNAGSSWLQYYLPTQFLSVAASPTVPGIAYVGTKTGIYRFQYGEFSQLGLADQSVTAIALDASKPGMIFAGTASGAYYSTDGGVSWSRVDSRLNGQTITAISFDKTIPNVVYFSTKTHGIYLKAIQF
jgi:photosystem II stability/assembly factor-like uncharacterized protein